MKLIKKALFISAIAVFCLALKTQKVFGQELLSYDSYFKTLTGTDILGAIETKSVKLKISDGAVLKSDKGEGQYLDFSIHKEFDGEYRIRQRNDIDLLIKSRSSFPGSVKYEVTGDIFRQEIDLMNPIFIEKEVFGSQQTLNVSGAGIDLNLEQRVGLNRMEVFAAKSGFKPETITVLMGLVDFLPDLNFLRGLPSYQAELAGKSKNNNLSFRMQKIGNDTVYADGSGIDLKILSRKVGSVDTEYEITGSAFGMEFGFRDFIIRTDNLVLGHGGYRVKAPGVDLKISHANIALREVLNIRGYSGKSPELTVFLLSFAQYILR